MYVSVCFGRVCVGEGESEVKRDEDNDDDILRVQERAWNKSEKIIKMRVYMPDCFLQDNDLAPL